MQDKITILERITIALQRTDKSQRDLAKYMGLSPSAVNRMLSKEVDSLKYIQAVEDLTRYRFEWLRTGKGAESVDDESNIDDQSLAYLKDKLKTKDDLIREQSGRIEDLQKLTALLESQVKDLKERMGLKDNSSLTNSRAAFKKQKTGAKR